MLVTYSVCFFITIDSIPSAAAANATAAKEMWAASARIVRAHGVRF